MRPTRSSPTTCICANACAPTSWPRCAPPPRPACRRCGRCSWSSRTTRWPGRSRTPSCSARTCSSHLSPRRASANAPSGCRPAPAGAHPPVPARRRPSAGVGVTGMTTRRLVDRLGGLAFGGDYNPEQWDEPVWRQDDELMRVAGVNLATVGVFSWALLGPAAGRYEFAWLDAHLDRLHANGVAVDLATPTASPPPWFSLAHPDALPVTADGTRLVHGSRDTYCLAAPAYRDAARRIAAALGERYGDHPALALWHVHNEYATLCWC